MTNYPERYEDWSISKHDNDLHHRSCIYEPDKYPQLAFWQILFPKYKDNIPFVKIRFKHFTVDILSRINGPFNFEDAFKIAISRFRLIRFEIAPTIVFGKRTVGYNFYCHLRDKYRASCKTTDAIEKNKTFEEMEKAWWFVPDSFRIEYPQKNHKD